jgi:transposase
MARHLPLDHFCPWREEAEELRQRVTSLEAKRAVLERHVFGRKRERLPGVEQQLRREQAGQDTEERRQRALDKRRQRAARRAEAPTREVHHPVPEAQRICPACGGDELKPLGTGRTTVVYEYIPARFEKQVHVQQTLACGRGVVTAPPPPKVVDRGEYGPGFIAHVVGSKCADAMPMHRLARRLERGGVPMSRSTLTDLFHLAAEVLSRAPVATHCSCRSGVD